ncbi:MAG: SDR family NAD(P)-dependent oxidoreductase [Brevefilum sp.]|nr:SDR family NAD(P)-dependent oxidoreductase [Brevefilum sp.]
MCFEKQEIDLTGKTIVLTGATSGIGFASVKKLASSGAYVIGVGRSETRNQKALEGIQNAFPNAHVDYLFADLASQDQVKKLAEDIKVLLQGHEINAVDVLVNNAGIYLEKKQTTKEGIEQTFAVNHLAAFLLSHELMPLLQASNQGRIITVSSYSHRNTPLIINRLDNPWPYIGLLAYKRSKLCNILFSYEFNRRHDNKVTAIALDPGLVDTSIASKGSNGISDWVWRLRRKDGESPDVPAEAITYLAGVENVDISQGYFYRNCEPEIPSMNARNEDLAEKLWQRSCELTNIIW